MTDRKFITDAVKAKYGAVAKRKTEICCAPGCCSTDGDQIHIASGYSTEELATLPKGSELGLGCGNPTAHAEIRPGEVVVDLGSGAGVDCFLAARKVGERGLVIGVDMTKEMLERARKNATAGGFGNVEFRQGEIDDLPLDANATDLVISNCVINLAPDKTRVFREIYRTLKPGGRVCVSDVVSNGQIPESVRGDLDRWAGCIGGALEKNEYVKAMTDVGFEKPVIRAESDYQYETEHDFTLSSITVLAYKPKNGNGHGH